MHSDSVQDAHRFAAIDIGTVTCRMLVADVTAQSAGLELTEIAKEYEVVNLGQGTDASGMLAIESMERAANAIRGFLKIRDSLRLPGQPDIPTMTVSTSAARDASNSCRFAEMLGELGLTLEVISGTTEAALSFKGATLTYIGKPVVVIDVGGGSCEIAIGIGGQAPTISHSFDVGCRRITERFFSDYPPTRSELDEASDFVRSTFEGWFESGQIKGILADLGKPTVIAVAGTATSAVTIRDEIEPYDASLVDGVQVTIAELDDITSDLSAMTLEQIEGVVGLDPKRASVIVAGLLILREAVIACGASEYVASEHDILDGIIMYNFQESTGERGISPIR